MQSRLILCILAALWATLPAQAQEKYTIQFKKLAQGESELVEKVDVESNTLKLVDKAGKEIKDLSLPNKETRVVYRVTIVEKLASARLATKAKRQYELATVTAEGKAAPLPYQGKTVLIEKKEGDYRFTIEGGEALKGLNSALLQKDFNNKKETEPDFEKLMLPTKAVAVGETWEMDRVAILKGMKFGGDGLVVDEAKVKGTGKLIRAYKKDGRQFGVLQMELILPISSSKGLDVEKGAKMVFSYEMDRCIDGTETTGTVNGRIVMSMRGRITGTDNGVVMTGGGTFIEIHKAAR